MGLKSETSDIESEKTSENDHLYQAFESAGIRNAFIRKVYALLAMQFALSTVIIAVININVTIKVFFLTNPWIFWVVYAGFFIVYLLLACCENLRRNVPINFIMLFIFTFCMGCLLGFTCLFYDLEAILFATGLTFVICLTVSLFSYFTSFDFTKLAWIMFIVLLVFFFAGIILIFVHNRISRVIYAAFGVGIFTIYLAIDTQMLIGGRRLELSPEEYILATIQLYLDIIYIFMFLLQIIGGSRK